MAELNRGWLWSTKGRKMMVVMAQGTWLVTLCGRPDGEYGENGHGETVQKWGK